VYETITIGSYVTITIRRNYYSTLFSSIIFIASLQRTFLLVTLVTAYVVVHINVVVHIIFGVTLLHYFKLLKKYKRIQVPVILVRVCSVHSLTERVILTFEPLMLLSPTLSYSYLHGTPLSAMDVCNRFRPYIYLY